jgi:hypothetical protein
MPSTTAPPFIKATVLSLASGSNPFNWLQEVDVYTNAQMTTPIPYATVTVNGTTLSYDATKGRYVGNMVIAAGAAVNLNVAIGSASYTATGTQYTTFPNVTSPSSGALWQDTSANNINWTAGAPFTGATTYAYGLLDSNGDFYYPNANGLGFTSANTFQIPANTLDAGVYQVLVGIGTTGIGADNTGGITIANTVAGSGLWIGGIGSFVPVVVK